MDLFEFDDKHGWSQPRRESAARWMRKWLLGQDGPVSEPTAAELRRLAMPPHDRASGLRLACQVKVLGDVTVTRHAGLFGQKTDQPKL